MKVIYIILGILLIGMIATPNLLQAEQPTQQFNKIFLDPFYRQSLLQDTDYSYTLNVNPPDKVGYVNSAIITFQMWLNPTVDFDLTVDGQLCNTPSYQVHTTFAGAGEGTILFDCSNVIDGEGSYDIVLRSSKNTGAITGWVDLTYTNSPKGKVEVHGTEYVAGDKAKVWLQLLDGNGTTVDEGVCYVDIYTPNNLEYIEEATMTNMEHDGIYYYDLTAPTELGVYPSVARCFYNAIQNRTTAQNYTLRYGKLDGGTIADTYTLNGQYLKLDTDDTITPQKRLDVNFTFQNVYSVCGNVDELLLSGLTFSWTGKWNTGTTGHNIDISVFNHTSNLWIPKVNRIPGGLGGDLQTVTNSISLNNLTTSLGVTAIKPLQLKFNNTISGDGKKDWDTDYLYVSCDQLANPDWQEVRGSSELHINKGLNTTAISQSVWNYTERNLTSFDFIVEVNTTSIAEAVWNYNGTIISNILDQIVLEVWSAVDRNLTFYENFTVQQQDLTDYDRIFEGVWNNTDRNLSYYENFTVQQVDLTNYTLIEDLIESNANNITAQDVWEFASRNLTFYQNFTVQQIDLTNYTLIDELINASANGITPQQIWEYSTRNLTYYENFTVQQQDLTNYTLIEELIQASENNITAQNIWEYTSRNLTYYMNFTVQQIDLTNYTLVEDLIEASANNITPQDIWQYSTRNLTYYENFTVQQMDLTNYTLIEDLIEASENNITTQDIWEYVNRNLTFYQNFSIEQLDLTNYTQIQTMVWNATVRELTNYNQTAIDYELIQGLIWNATTRTLTNFTFIVDTSVNYTEIANQVWNRADRNLTYYENFTVEQVDLTNYTLIDDLINASANGLTPQQIWEYASRNITSFEFDVVNETAIAEAIWNFNGNILSDILNQFASSIWNFQNRTLTDFNFTVNTTVVVNSTEISENVWEHFNRTLTDYNQTDLTDYDRIQEMAWNATIRTLTDFNFTVIANVNTTEISNAVWNNTDKNLTYYPAQTDLTDYGLIQSVVWNASTRELTYYPNLNVSVNVTAEINVTELQDDITCVITNLLEGEEGWGVQLTEC